jgi:hypothetical protein
MWLSGAASIGSLVNAGTSVFSGTLDINDQFMVDLGNTEPVGNGTRDLGSSSHHWDEVFTENIKFKPGLAITNTINSIGAGGDGMVFNVPENDEYEFRQNNIHAMTLSPDSNDNMFFRSQTGRNVGYKTNNDSSDVGSAGTIGLPNPTSIPTSAAGADSRYGAVDGAIGYFDSGSATSIFFRQKNGNWSLLLIGPGTSVFGEYDHLT